MKVNQPKRKRKRGKKSLITRKLIKQKEDERKEGIQYIY